jgi:hypothetical protein
MLRATSTKIRHEMIMRSPKFNLVLSLFLLCTLAFAWTTPAWGRADRVFFGMPGPISEEERATLGGVIAVTHAQYAPEVKFETYAKGKASGTAQGAAEGFLSAVGQMGHCGGDFCAIAALFWIATAGTAGAVYGAVTGYQDALPAEEAERIEQSTKRLLESLAFQEQMADRLVQTVQRKTVKLIVKPDAMGPARPGENCDYGRLKNKSIGSVLEVAVREIGLETPPRNAEFDRKDPPLHLVIKIDAKLQRMSDGKILYNPTSLQVGARSFRKAEWEADNSRRFLEQVDLALNALAEKIVDDVFLTIELAALAGEAR